jgi:hypothetical protein
MTLNEERKRIGYAIVILTFLVIGAYSLFNFKSFLEGPQIEIASPATGSTLDERFIEIKGTAEHVSFISLNNRPININEENKFQEKLLLQDGYNIITLYAKDRFGREIKKHIQLVVKEGPKNDVSKLDRNSSKTEEDSL